MGACCFKPSVSEDAAVSASGAAVSATGARGQRTSRGSGLRAVPDVPGPGNKLLCRKAPAWSSEAPMTMGQLKSKRDEFWDTEPAFHGRQEIWQALKAAAECEDADTAQAIISAISVTLPQGNLSVVYDQLGNKYDIPPYCLSEPVNLVKDEGQQAAAASVPTPGENAPEESQVDAKTAAAAPVELNVKIRLSTQRELLWSGAPDTTVGVLKRFVEEHEAIAPERQRFLFGGQLLQDSKTLAQAKVPSNCVVQVMVNTATPE